ncbi:MAG: hypothetical protein EHM58_05885 [Ignavibacteriae bacterium]|nr:MAG: hypothetical protein EHM58_05885 [Ignavibacteriota bacterium]
MDDSVLFHITQVTHSTRKSDRMKRLNIKLLNPIKLTLEDEIILAKWFAKLVIKHKYIIFAYNSCCDHIHFVNFSRHSSLKIL